MRDKIEPIVRLKFNFNKSQSDDAKYHNRELARRLIEKSTFTCGVSPSFVIF